MVLGPRRRRRGFGDGARVEEGLVLLLHLVQLVLVLLHRFLELRVLLAELCSLLFKLVFFLRRLYLATGTYGCSCKGITGSWAPGDVAQSTQLKRRKRI